LFRGRSAISIWKGHCLGCERTRSQSQAEIGEYYIVFRATRPASTAFRCWLAANKFLF